MSFRVNHLMKQFNFMKIRYILIIISFPLISFSQETQRKFRFGLKATPIISWINPDFSDIQNDPTMKYSVQGGGGRLGFIWGPSAEFFLNETFLFSTGADFNYSSFKIEGTKDGISWEQLYKTRYVDIPLMLKFRSKEIGSMRYFGLFGLYAGFNTSTKTEFSEFYANNTIVRNDKSDNYVRGFRGGLLVGAGAEYNISGNTSLIVSIVFNNGLTNSLKDQKDYKEENYKNIKEFGIVNNFLLNLGVLF